jgi:hypothetical protein
VCVGGLAGIQFRIAGPISKPPSAGRQANSQSEAPWSIAFYPSPLQKQNKQDLPIYPFRKVWCVYAAERSNMHCEDVAPHRVVK